MSYNSIMKQLINNILITLSLLYMSGCTPSPTVAPTQNDALNKISNSNAKKEKSYFLQNQFDYFVDKELTPTVVKDKEIQKKYMDKVVDKKTGKVTYKDKESDYFTLQETCDKIGVYMREHPSDYSKSTVHKLEMMPVIGSSAKRR